MKKGYRQYYIAVNDISGIYRAGYTGTDRPGYKPVEGKAVQFPECSGFVHRTGHIYKYWKVSELITGTVIADGATMKEAIANATAKLAKVGKKETQNCIAGFLEKRMQANRGDIHD